MLVLVVEEYGCVVPICCTMVDPEVLKDVKPGCPAGRVVVVVVVMNACVTPSY